MIRNLTAHPVRLYRADTPDVVDDPDHGLAVVLAPAHAPA
jgi:hypothetical protein